MNRKLPPNLYARQYRTKAGYTQTLYYARFVDSKGIRRFFSLGENFTEAKTKLFEYKTLDGQGHDFDKAGAKGATLFPWIDKILAIKKNKPIAERHGYSGKHLKEFFLDCPLATITASKMLEYRAQRDAAVATINRELALLRSVFILAKADRAIDEIPKIPFEEEHNERIRTATEIEYKKIMRALNPDDRDFAEIVREMGFRPKDVHMITPADIIFEGQAINMKRIRSKFGHKRPLPLSPRAWSILSRRAKGKQKNELLFPFTRHRVRTAFMRAAKRLGTDDLWLYDLKATFATEKLRQGWPMEIIMEFTGHKTRKAFARYVRPTMEDLEAFIRPAKPLRQRKPKSHHNDNKAVRLVKATRQVADL